MPLYECRRRSPHRRFCVSTQSAIATDLLKTSEVILSQLAAGKRRNGTARINIVSSELQSLYISWLAYDPAKEIANLTVPGVTQGTTDIQRRAGCKLPLG